LADGIVVTSSHNPPEMADLSTTPPSGGPADVDATNWIQDRANGLLRDGMAQVKRTPLRQH
jgi:phosphoglucomutase